MNRRITSGLLLVLVVMLSVQLVQTAPRPARAGSIEGPKTEACCFVDGSCVEVAPGDCLSFGGYPAGPGTTCDGANCVPGACCPLPGKEICINGIFEQQCLDQGGQFYGSGSMCDDVQCLTPPCPSDVDGDGTVGVLDFLQVLEDWGPCP